MVSNVNFVAFLLLLKAWCLCGSSSAEYGVNIIFQTMTVLYRLLLSPHPIGMVIDAGSSHSVTFFSMNPHHSAL